jgi:MFS family permease
MADLIPAESRIDAYALFRLSNNLGVALGPAIGGWLASTSYTLAFFSATIGMTIYSLMLALFARETLPLIEQTPETLKSEALGGYPEILRDRPFMSFIGAFTLVSMCATLIWTLMSVYAKTNYQLTERSFGFIPTTNALMVVTMQLTITSRTKRYPILPVLAAGAALYAIAVGSVALATGFWGFWLSMVVMTFGELILVPTASTYVANHAPKDKRGRYMGIFGLTWSVAAGLAPIFGGLLNDNLGPHFIWLGGSVAGFLSVLAFLVLYQRSRNMETSNTFQVIN